MPLPVEYIGAPFDWGASRRGCRLAPDALRALGVIERLRAAGLEVADGGNVTLPAGLRPDTDPATGLNNLALVQAMGEALAERVENALMTDRFPLVLGGDHTIALGSIGGAARVIQPLGLLWIDAHGDYNDSQSSPSGNIHGMPLAAVLGQADAPLVELAGPGAKVRAEHTAIIGVRDIDAAERPRLEASGMLIVTSDEVAARGIEAVLDQALPRVMEGTGGFHCSFDVDALDPLEMPGTGTTAPGGLSLAEGLVIVRRARASGGLRSIDFAELNPLLDMAGLTCGRTLELVLAVCA